MRESPEYLATCYPDSRRKWGGGMVRTLGLSKASSEKGHRDNAMSCVTNDQGPLSGMLLYTPRGVLGRQGRLGAGQDVDRGGVKKRETRELRM